MANRRQTASERSDVIFHIYVEMGPRRSLAKLRRRLGEFGWSISLSTLKLYSSRDGWRQRIERLDAEAAERRRKSSVSSVMAMEERQAQLDRALQGAGGTALRRLLEDDARLSQMKPSEIARLLELGMREERRAVGEVAMRADVQVTIWNTVTKQIIPAFIEANKHPDVDVRARRFIETFDRIIDEHLRIDAGEHPGT